MCDRLAIRSRRTVVGDEVRPATVVIDGDTIEAVVDHRKHGDARVVDVGANILMPALIDTHVHVNEPGRTDWEGFETATRAAAAGGSAVIVDMPLNSVPPTTTVDGLEAKRRAAAGRCRVDVGFWGGVVPGGVTEIPALAEAGVFGFKVFLAPSGVDEFGHIGFDHLEEVLAAAARYDIPLLVHAEAPGHISPVGDEAGYASYLASRPPIAEIEAVQAVVEAARRTGGHAHVLHASAAGAVAAAAAARKAGHKVTVETCPHYLALAAEDVPADGVAFKCAPPIREASNRAALWGHIAAGDIDLVVSDHSPSTPELKRGGFAEAWGGIASVELRLAVVWTEAVQRSFGPADLAHWLCAAPAALAGLPTGRLAPGMRADLVIWDPEATFTVDRNRLHQRHPMTPYAGRALRGVVHSTWVRGTMVYDGSGFPGPPTGTLLERP